MDFKEKIKLPEYYNNSKEVGGSIYKIATKRGWNFYLSDVVKRLERGGKKDPLEQEIKKSIGVLQLWLKELQEEKETIKINKKKNGKH